ncbi:RsmD family RNA methyltransferase [Candidatus Dojkabacteria bacterium]|uniref:RsmD family RNA methyltransferase n=1 Tax=Candidatus Dojkabacteria bacterium TaxID=2099670 RepID=A0A955KZV2_9BACT|nr:RsmD family RNA methyltransferase [Candidatus Dojkabacteria bacterium]
MPNGPRVKILGGSKRGRFIETPSWALPASEITRQYIFEKLGNTTKKSRVVDLYAGGGTYGIESLSRGAQRAIFVDYEIEAKQIIQKNLHSMGFSTRAWEVQSKHVRDFIQTCREKFDIIFIDPPYPSTNNPALATTHRLLDENGIIILRHRRGNPNPTIGNYLKLLHTKTIDGHEILFLNRTQD